MKQREKRIDVEIPARIRWDGRWLPASVRNVSSQGMLLRLPQPPDPGTYVEIEVGRASMVARSVWSAGQTCGLRSRETFDIAAFSPSRGAATLKAAAKAQQPAPVRYRASVDYRAERSRQMGMLFQYLTLTVVAAAAAAGIGWEVYRTLSAPIDQISMTLEQR